jgi:hypothetical protein
LFVCNHSFFNIASFFSTFLCWFVLIGQEPIVGSLRVPGDNSPAFFGKPENEELAKANGIQITGLQEVLKVRTSF